MIAVLQPNPTTAPVATGAAAGRAMLAADSPLALSPAQIAQGITHRFDAMLAAAKPGVDASSGEPPQLFEIALPRTALLASAGPSAGVTVAAGPGVPKGSECSAALLAGDARQAASLVQKSRQGVRLPAGGQETAAPGLLVEAKRLLPGAKRHVAKSGIAGAATLDASVAPVSTSPVATLLPPVAATVERFSKALSRLPESELAGSPLATGDTRHPAFAAAQITAADGPTRGVATVATAAPTVPAIAAEASLSITLADAAEPAHPVTMPRLVAALGANNSRATETSALPAASTLLAIPTSLMPTKARADQATTPVAADIGERHAVTRLDQASTAASPSAADAPQRSEGGPIGTAPAAQFPLPVADAPVSPHAPDRLLPRASGTPADVPTTSSGEPGFSIASQLLGPVSAALIPLNAAGNLLHVQFTVDRPATAKLIAGGTDRLDLTLNATGMQLEKLSVEVDRRAEVTTPQPESSGSPSSGSHSPGSPWAGSHSATTQQDAASGFGQRGSRHAPSAAPESAVQRGRSHNPVASPRDRFA